MTKPVSMKETVNAIRNAYTVTEEALGFEVNPEIFAAVLPQVVREFLDNEYVDDLDHIPVEERRPRPVRS